MAESEPDEDPIDTPLPAPGSGPPGTRQLGKKTQERSSSGSSKSLTEAIVLDAGPDIPSINADEFIADFLPKVPGTEAVIGRIVSWIEACPTYYADRRWAGFPEDPADSGDKEDAVFAQLSVVSDAILAAVSELKPELVESHTTEYVAKPTKPPETVFRRDLSRPDAYFLFKKRFSRDKENPHWMDIAVSGEFKKDNNPETAESDITQVLWDMHQSLREDPRRRRCYGFTIENRAFRMYSITRSEIVVSRAVDFLSSPRHIIKFFFALMFASEEALGRDMTMTPIWNGDVHTTPQYDIRVHSRKDAGSPVVVRTFRTIELISSIGAEAIRGRGTRVWKVNEVKRGRVDKKVTYVLKDVWVDSDRTREGKVVAEIRKDAENHLTDEVEKRVLLHCLLKTLVEGDVLLSDGTKDCTISGRKRRRHIVTNTDRFSLTPYTAPSKPKPSPSLVAPPPKRKKKPKRGGVARSPGDHQDATDGSESSRQAIVYDAKTHYRIVFEEVCEVLHELTSLRKIVYTLWKVSRGLEILHKLGWVHRDISSGNIMLCGEDAKITDFEYAKKMTLPGKAHEIRTGTEDFMAIEVRAQAFNFLNTRLTTFNVECDDGDAIGLDDFGADVEGMAPQPAPLYTWFYNPLHDMESIFWLLLYFVTNKDIVLGDPIARKVPYAFSPETEEEYHHRILEHWKFGITLFSGRQGRKDVVAFDSTLKNHLTRNPLHPAIAPLAEVIVQLRDALVTTYYQIERNPPAIDHDSGKEIHKIFGTLFRRAGAHIREVPFDLQVQSLRSAVDKLPKSSSTLHASIGSKRLLDDDENHGRLSKVRRVSVNQKSPSRAASADVQSDKTAPDPKPIVALPTRVLRSHSRKAKTPPSPPRPAARARKTAVPQPRAGKVTKNDEAAKAATKVAATKAKTKTRKGR